MTPRAHSEQPITLAPEAEGAILRSLDAVISLTPDGFIAKWNVGAEKLLGYTRGEILDRHISELVSNEERTVLEDLLDDAYDGTRCGARDSRWRHGDGYEVDVSISLSSRRGPDGEVLGYVTVVREISERRRSEYELNEAPGAIARRARSHAGRRVTGGE